MNESNTVTEQPSSNNNINNNNGANSNKTVYSTAYREELWSKVLKLRSQQLQSFTNDELTKIAKSSLEKDSNVPIPEAALPKEEETKYVLKLLELNFRQACNEANTEDYRQGRFNTLKVMFGIIDSIYDQNNKNKSSSVVVMSESATSDVNSTSQNNTRNSKEQPQQVTNSNGSTLPNPFPMPPSVRKESQPTDNPKKKPRLESPPAPASPKKKKPIEILTITDSDDEVSNTPTPPRYPNMSQNYNLVDKMNMRSDEKKGTSHSLYSSAIHERPALQLILSNDHIVSPAHGLDVIRRLTKWEPNFIIRENLVVLKTAPPAKVSYQSTRIKTCLGFKFTIPKSYIYNPDIKWKQQSLSKNYTTGNKLLLLRMLPKEPAKKYPDTHLWPKGTFFQLNSIPTPLNQRKQQSHNDKLWKSMCSSLDLTPHIHPTLNTSHTIELVTYDDTPFYLHLAIVEYISPQDLMSSVTNNIVSYQTSLQKAKYYVNRQTVKLDDDDNDEETKNSIPLTFSLSCPISMVKISTPTRGRNCNHVQCFDLLTFLSSNSFPSARRWRCVFCEKFTSVDELVICQMFNKMLEKFSNEIEPGSKDKIELKDYGDECSNDCNNDNWTLMDQKLHKRGGVSEEQEDSMSKKRKKIEEIILV